MTVRLEKRIYKMATKSNTLRILLYVLIGIIFVRIIYEPCELSLAAKQNLKSEATSDAVSDSQGKIQKTEATSEATLNKFDSVSKSLFKRAISTGLDSTERKPFVLDSNWKNGTGGLNDEDRLTIGDLYYKASSVFEFGLGESTLIAAATQVPRYSGVDSDSAWVKGTRDSVTEKNRMNHFTSMSHFRFYFSDIGATGAWGFPYTNLPKNLYNYQVAALMAEQEAFDVYLIDGRYRVACACVSFLHALKYGGDLEKIRIAVHDNHDRRRGYGVLQEVADVVIKNKMLWVYKLKNNPNIEQDVFDLWQRVHEKEGR